MFGTKNLIELCEKYRVKRFLMVSTDKAVNPTSKLEMNRKLDMRKRACDTEDDNAVWMALMDVVPTFKSAEEVNGRAERSSKMKQKALIHVVDENGGGK